MAKKKTKVIGIVSGKGGTGKTITAINLGMALHEFGRDIIVLDGSLGTPDVSNYLGEPVLENTLHHALQGKKEITKTAYKHPSGLRIIPGSMSLNDYDSIESENFKKHIDKLNNKIEGIIVDMPTGIGKELRHVMDSTDYVLIVTNPDLVSVTNALKVIKIAEGKNKKIIGVIVNHVNEKSHLSDKNIEEILNYKIIGKIPHDKLMHDAIKSKNPVVFSHPEADSSIEFKRIAAKLLGEKYEHAIEKQSSNLFDYMIKNLGLKK